jgi:hypothetical protein
VKVLVKEKIGDSGVQLLRDAGLEVELGTGVAAAQRVFLEAGVPVGSAA